MTEILCRWLNEDIKLSQQIEASNLAQNFSNGFLLGEILNKHGLQDDFEFFSQNKQASSKLNNFMRLQPTINLLEISFNTNIAREIMQEKHTTITQLLYQMYIALTNKEKRNLTGAAMETMRPGAPVKLEQHESIIYQKNLKSKTPRQTDLNLEMLRARYDKYKVEKDQLEFDTKFKQEENLKIMQQNKRTYLLNKSKEFRQQQAELFAKINSKLNDDELNFTIEDGKFDLASVVQIPKTPPKFKKEAIVERQKLFERNEGEKALKEIDLFEKKYLKSNRDQNDITIVNIEEERGFDDSNEIQNKLDPADLFKPNSNDDYIFKIRSRLQEDAHARKEREKRRRKVLVDQLKANEALEDLKREEALVAHLLRQSQFERRIAAELLHARHEKDVLTENRIAKEREILERREKEFQDALDKERELARLAKLDYLEQAKKDKEFHDLIAADRAEAKYKKHYELCSEILNQIFEFSCKVAEYRELTDNFIPPKIWRDWLSLFRAGKPLYPSEPSENTKDLEKVFNADTAKMTEDTHDLLDNCDFNEYKEMIGEWEPIEKINNLELVPVENKIIGHIIHKLHDLCYPPQPGAPKPIFPVFPLKCALLGKPFSGKTASLKILEEMTGIHVLNPLILIEEAIEEYKKNPIIAPATEPEIPEAKKAKLSEDTSQKSNESFKNQNIDEDQDLKSKKSKNSDKEEVVEEKAVVENHDPNLMLRQLGELALKSLSDGEPVRDEITVHILAEKIKTLSQDKGFIIDGFPTTFEQAKLLEKALTGFDENQSKLEAKLKKDSVLAPNPKPEPPRPKHKSGIDLVIYFDLSDNLVLNRSVGRYFGTISNTLFHQQFKTPPEGSYTGLNKVETIEPVKDASNDMEQIQHRITAFEDEWKKIKKFYEDYSYVSLIQTGEDDNQKLANEILNQIELFNKMKENKFKKEMESKLMLENLKHLKQKEEEEERLAKKKQEEAEAEAEAKRQLEAKKAQEALEKSSPKSSAKGKKGGKSPKTSKSKSPEREKEKSKSPKGSKKSASPKGKDKKSKPSTPAPVAPVPAPEPVKQSDEPPQPGDDNYVYLNEKIDMRMAKVLCDHWDVVESSYINGSKFVFRKIRKEREQIIRYFHNIKSNFKEYLKRPDTKQIELESFIKEYNKISEDMREDEEVKAELHQRVEDLKENLWKICDIKKLESEKEREQIMVNGWLQDKIGFLSNHYITQMQVELDRFQDTSRMLKDYYKLMQTPMPDEWPKEYPRLALIDLKNPDEEYPSSQLLDTSESNEKLSNESSSDGKNTPNKSPRNKSPRTKSPKSPKSKSPVGGKKGTQASQQQQALAAQASKKGKKTPDGEELIKKNKIPLIPRRPGSQDGKDGKKAKPKPKGDDSSPPPPEDQDERLVYEAYKNAVSYVNTIVGSEVAILTADEQPEGQVPEDPKQKGKKGAKSRTPSAKKKAESPKGKGKGKSKDESAPVPDNFDTFSLTSERSIKLLDTIARRYSPVQAMSDEEKARKLLKEKIKKEYLTALRKDESIFKARIELIRSIAIKVINDLKQKGENTYKEMDDKLGERFLKEMKSIDNLCNFIKYSIENKQKIKKELVLEQDEFYINDDIAVLRTPTPPPRPDPIEYVTVEQFTIESLIKCFNQFKQVAPEGLVAVKTFTEIFNDLILLNQGNDILPEQWSNLSQSQIESLSRMLASGSEFVDWRLWLLAASAPWPYPTQTQLLKQLKDYRLIDKNNTGFINKRQFLQTPLWFFIEKPQTPNDLSHPHMFDRHSNLVNFWFDLFSTKTPSLPNLTGSNSKFSPSEDRLDYKIMLLYLSAVSDPYDGFLRALSVSQEAPMPRREPRIQMKAPSFNTPEYEQLKLLSAQTEKYPDDQIISIDALYRVFHHGERQRGDTHRFAQTEDPEDFMSYQRIMTIFEELNEEAKPYAQFSKLIAHPVLCEMISICNKFRSPDFRTIFVMDDVDLMAQDRRSPE